MHICLRIKLSNVRAERANGHCLASFVNTCKSHVKSFYLRLFIFVFDIKLAFLNIVIRKYTTFTLRINRLTLFAKQSFLMFTTSTYQFSHFNMMSLRIRDVQLNPIDINILNDLCDLTDSTFYVFQTCPHFFKIYNF